MSSNKFTPVEIKQIPQHERKNVIDVGEGRFMFPFPITSPIFPQWHSMFTDAWQARVNSMPRPSGRPEVEISQSRLRVTCRLEDLESLMTTVKEIMNDTNRRYEEAFKKRTDEEAERKKKEGEEKEQRDKLISDTLNKLDLK